MMERADGLNLVPNSFTLQKQGQTEIQKRRGSVFAGYVNGAMLSLMIRRAWTLSLTTSVLWTSQLHWRNCPNDFLFRRICLCVDHTLARPSPVVGPAAFLLMPMSGSIVSEKNINPSGLNCVRRTTESCVIPHRNMYSVVFATHIIICRRQEAMPPLHRRRTPTHTWEIH